MRITRENYEMFLMDYLDGNLDKALRAEVENFLVLNPDIKAELESFDDIGLTSQDVSFRPKDKLKKSPFELLPQGFKNEDDFFIAKLEGDLDLEQEKEFKNFLSLIPEKQKTYKLFRNTKLKPDQDIVFKEKQALKKAGISWFSTSGTRYALTVVAAAMAVIMFLFINRNYLGQHDPKVAVRQSETGSNNNSIKPIDEPGLVEEPASHTTIKITNTDIAKKEIPLEKKDRINKEAAQNENEQAPSEKIEALDFQKIDEAQQLELASVMEEEFNTTEYNAWIEPAWRIPDHVKKEVANAPELTIDEFLHQQFRKEVLKEAPEEYTSRKFSGWDIADAGLRSVGRLFDRDVKLEKKYDDAGKLVTLAYNGPVFQFETPLNRK